VSTERTDEPADDAAPQFTYADEPLAHGHERVRNEPPPNGHASAADVDLEDTEIWGIPADLWSGIAPTPPLPRGLLPGTLEAFAFAKPDTFSPAALASAALATCSICATDNMRLIINATWRERFCIWVGLYGPSSAAKSPTLSTALRPLVTEQQLRLEEYQRAHDAWKKAKKEAGEDFDDDEPIAVRYYTHSATIEALTEMERHTEHGVGLVHDELSALIAAMDGAYKEKSANERGHWLALYDGGGHYSDRIGRGAVFVKNHSAAILGGITTDKLASIVCNSTADGLMSRMSLCSVPVMAPSADLDAIPSDTYLEYEQLVWRLLRNRPWKTLDVTLPPQARACLGEAKKRWQSEAILYAERLPRYSERLGKLTGVAARIALGFAIIEAAEIPGAPGSGPNYLAFDPPRIVSAPQMQRACAYVDYQTQHDLAFYATAAGQDLAPAIVMARRVAGWLLQLEKQRFQLGDLTRGILEWRKLRSTEQLAALELLDQLQWVRPSDEVYFRGLQFVRGITWSVNPAAHQRFTDRAATARQVAAEARRRLQAAVELRRAQKGSAP
jgi:hypothetical protein